MTPALAAIGEKASATVRTRYGVAEMRKNPLSANLLLVVILAGAFSFYLAGTTTPFRPISPCAAANMTAASHSCAVQGASAGVWEYGI